MVVGQKNCFDVLISKIPLSSLFTPRGNMFILNYSYTFPLSKQK